MKIGVLTSTPGWHFQDLKRAAGQQHELIQLSFAEIAGTIQGSGTKFYVGDQPLSRFDCILVRAMPAGSLEQVVARMDLLFRLERSGTVIVNPAKSIEAAVDKYLSLCQLNDSGIAIPYSGVFQTIEPALNFLTECNLDAVYKPLFGSEGRGLQRLKDMASAKQLFQELVEAEQVIYLQQFVPDVVKDLRLFVIGDRVFGMARHNDSDWRKNVSLGAKATPHTVNSAERKLAIDCAKAVGTAIAGVDVLLDEDGRYRAIEVNSSPGWQTLSKTLNVDISAEIIRYLESVVVAQNRSS